CIGARALPADIDLFFDDLRLFIGFYRPPMEMQTRLGDFILRLAEAQLHRQLIRLHGIDRLEKPEAQDGSAYQKIDRFVAAALSATAAGENLLETVLAFAENIFKIGRSVLSAAARSLRPLPPGSAIIISAIIIIA